MKADHRATLLRRRVFSPGFFSVTFRAPELASGVLPGQFVMLEVPDRLRPYLRRAYSVADADPVAGEVEFLVRTIGPGTSAVEHLAEGSGASLLGPLGNGFSLEGLDRSEPVAVVAGGIGAAPFPLLFRALTAAGFTADLYLGGRNAAELGFRERFAGIVSGETLLATDDGSLGERGFVTAAFERRAAGRSRPYTRVYACGPMPMFAALAPVVARARVPAEFSTEAAMGCGFGACLGCVIPATEKPFVISCIEGPILAPEKIAWDALTPALSQGERESLR
ncbi:MAG TPA: dihydroorotate dehydrogenase electron transfer subunit [Thermoanaerobaculia bacterium]|nr:dihydroorotate dehydrogenase electron transfer subunit [Thermoanaerobaculia bacterium]